MKLHTKIELLKFCSTVLSFIFMVLGISVAGCGLWILYDTSFISAVSSDGLQVLALGLLAVGGLVLVVSVLGWVGAQRESRLLLLPVAVVLVLLVLAQVFVSLVLILSWSKISTAVTEAVDELILEYPLNKPQLLDDIQHHAGCCGQTGPSDWLGNGFVQNWTQSLNQSEAGVLPCSCFVWNVTRPESGTFCTDNHSLASEPDVVFANASYSSSYSEGCEAALRVWLAENFFTIIGLDLGLILIQILQLVVVVSLFRSFGRKSSVKSSEPDLDLDQDQGQVYSDQDLLHLDQDQGLYHGPYDGPYGEPYQDPNQNYSKFRK